MSARAISVVMAVRDDELHVREAIQSALAGERVLEVIVADDGSTDGSAAICESFGEAITFLRLAHGGPARARNACIDLARGRYVGFLDSDDLWQSPAPDRRAEVLDSEPGVACVCGRQQEFTVAADGSRQLRHATVAGTGAIMIRRGVLLAMGGFDPELVVGEDQDLLFRLRQAGHEIAVLDETVQLKRVRPRQVSADGDAMRLALLTNARRVIERTRQAPGATPTGR